MNRREKYRGERRMPRGSFLSRRRLVHDPEVMYELGVIRPERQEIPDLCENGGPDEDALVLRFVFGGILVGRGGAIHLP